MTERASSVCAVDVGSTFIKAAVYDRDLRVLGQARGDFPAIRDGERCEADLDQVWDAFASTTRAASIRSAVTPGALVLSVQMAGLALLDERGWPTGPAVLGIDGRGDGPVAFPQRTGCPPGGIYPATKLRWFARHAPRQLANARYIGGIKEFLLHRLTGEWITDPSSASATALYDLDTRSWWPEAVAAAGISAEQLPIVSTPGRHLEGHLDAPVTVLVGLGDGPAANLSSGAVGPNRLCLSLGTTLVVRLLVRGRAAPSCDVPLFVQHVVHDWHCIGVRFDVTATGVHSPVGAPATRLELATIPEVLAPLLQHYGVTALHPIGGRCRDRGVMALLAEQWGLPVHVTDAYDGTRGVALLATHGTDQPDELAAHIAVTSEIIPNGRR